MEEEEGWQDDRVADCFASVEKNGNQTTCVFVRRGVGRIVLQATSFFFLLQTRCAAVRSALEGLIVLFALHSPACQSGASCRLCVSNPAPIVVTLYRYRGRNAWLESG